MLDERTLIRGLAIAPFVPQISAWTEAEAQTSGDPSQILTSIQVVMSMSGRFRFDLRMRAVSKVALMPMLPEQWPLLLWMPSSAPQL